VANESRKGEAERPDAGPGEPHDTQEDATYVDSPAAKARSSGDSEGGSSGELTAATRLLSSGGGSSLSGSGPESGLGSDSTRASLTTTASPADAMMLEEVARSRFFLAMAAMLASAFLVSLAILGGNPTLKLVLAGTIVVVLISATVLYLQIRDPLKYSPIKMSVVALITAVSAYHGVFFWGVFSPAPALIVLGIYFISRSEGLRGALLVYLTCAFAQALLSGLILSGAISDPGLYPITEGPSLLEDVATQLLLQLIFLCTYLVGKQSRTTTLDAIEKVQEAMRQVAQREVLLQEARQDLDRALQIGGEGRYTDQVLGGYRLGVVIGRGAMGEVYEAFHTDSDEPAAVKLLHPHVLQKPNLVARFLREAQAAGALRSRHVVRVLQAGDPLAPAPFLVMERLHGSDLAEQLRKTRRLSLKKIARLARHVGQVIDEARPKGIVHRDLKPQNLFYAEQPNSRPIWKILDFGVSKLGAHSGTLTRGQVVGTPAYMPPEQARGEPVDYRGDLYALAAIVYRCATGRPPFAGKDLPAVLYNVVYKMPPRPSSLAELPEALDAVLIIGLAKRAQDRFASGAEFADAIAAAADGELGDRLELRARDLEYVHPWGKET